MSTYLGSTMWLVAASDRDVMFVVFAYREAIVFARPTHRRLSRADDTDALAAGVGAVGIALIPGAGGVIKGVGLRKLAREVQDVHTHFDTRGRTLTAEQLVAGINDKGWVAFGLPADQIGKWSQVPSKGMTWSLPPWKGMAHAQIQITATDGRRYAFGGGRTARENLTGLLRRMAVPQSARTT